MADLKHQRSPSFVNSETRLSMIREICLDANVILSCLVVEPDQESCRILLQQILTAEIDIYAPSLMIFEVASILQRKTYCTELSAREASDALNVFTNLPVLFQGQTHIMKKAFRLAQELSLKNTYDTAYLAVAETRQIPCITCDVELRKKGRAVYDQIFTPDEFLKIWSPPL